MNETPITDRYIIDNRSNRVAEHLKRTLVNADAFSFVSAYFTIYGYDLLAETLDRVVNVRFLFGDPVSVEELDPGTDDEPKSFKLTEQGLEPNQILKQKAIARRCAQWFRRNTVTVRSTSRSNFLHGKMYIAGSKTHSALVGSSNFTKRGLGGSDQSNLEINLATKDANTVGELLKWFNQLWNDKKLTQDVKQQVLNALERIGKDYAPQDVYYKTLFELFRRNIEARLAGDDDAATTGFQDSQVWNTLYEFQKDGAKSVIAKLREHNGCILADSVGLGKTYTALAVIHYFELRNERVLVLCPRKLIKNWRLYPITYAHKQNPFPEDRFVYTALAHTDLSRDSGYSGGVDLAEFNWSNYDLVVIDESHNFRNDGGKRYKRLLDEVIKAGCKTKVLMLSATPVNTSLIDLRNQIYLMTEGRESAFRKSLKVGDIRNMMAAAQRQFKDWEQTHRSNGYRDNNTLEEKIGADFFRLLGGVSISRSRRQVKQFYAEEMKRIGQFPKRLQPKNMYPKTDEMDNLSYKKLADRIGEFRLAVYQPSEYVTDPTRLADLEFRRKEQNFNQQDSERFLVGMIRVNFLKRLESSAYALQLTLGRTVKKIDNLLKKIDSYEQDNQTQYETLRILDLLPNDEEEDEEFFVNRGNKPYHLRELDLLRWRIDLDQDKDTLSEVLNQVNAITPERDGKLQQIKKDILNKMTNPSHNQDGQPNRKLLVFTTFKDTATYLYENLLNLVAGLGINMAMVSGDENRTTDGINEFNSILTNFAPVARQRSGDVVGSADIDLLIATDCISEGQNLQDCDTVLNYDIHWNPVRLIQRFGRIDRIGSRNNSVQMVNYWPTKDMETYLRLQNRVQARMALADLAATGDEDPFTKAEAQGELKFRDAQLMKLRDEVPDPEDLEKGPSMGDFTLDHFFTQLLRHLESKKDMLESMPSGVYAITATSMDTPPGTIFFLRQRNVSSDASEYCRLASPVHPFHFVYIQDNGNIRHGCLNVRQILEVFQATAIGKTKPIAELCNHFDQKTNYGQNMVLYDKMLNDAIAHIRQTYNQEQTKGLGLDGNAGFKLSPILESPRATSDFELITWLVIKEK